MASPPARTELADTYPNPSNAVFRNGIGKLHDWLIERFGTGSSLGDSRRTLGIGPLGQCRLVKSGANLLLSRFEGCFLTINDQACLIPQGGVSLAVTGLLAGTSYFIYATAAAGVVSALEASTTGHSTDTTTGVEIKTGDVTRSLVGMARPITGPAWQDAPNQRFVISWFNQRPRALRTSLGATASTISSSLGELNASLRNEFLAWAGSAQTLSVTGSASNNTGAASFTTALSRDGSTTLASNSPTPPAGAPLNNISMTTTDEQTVEGYHYFTLLGAVSSGTGTWQTDIRITSTIQG